MTSLLEWLDRFQRRHRWAAFPFAVVKKFGQDSAGNLAALIAYYAFFSVFPLLLAFSTILGFVLHGHPDWQRSVEHSAFAQLPLVASKDQPAPLHGSIAALVVGLALALWSGLGVGKTAQTAFNTVYLVPLKERPNFLTSTLRALGLIVVGGLGLIVTTALSSAVTSAPSVGGLDLGPGLRVAGTALAVALNTVLFLVLFRWLTVRHVPWRHALPGAIISAAALQILQLAATAFIDHKLKGASSTYGKNFGAVVVLLSWFYLQAQVVLLAAEVNVVREYKLWPRGLRDDPSTEADHRAYEAYRDEVPEAGKFERRDKSAATRRGGPDRPAGPSDPG